MLPKFARSMSQFSRQAAYLRLQLTNSHLLAHFSTSASSLSPTYGSVAVGQKYTEKYQNYGVDTSSNKILSYFHDIPLNLDLENNTAQMVVEVPRWLNAKFEINTKLPGNPIVQDVKKGKVRFVRNLFPYHGYIHNYGAFPQTWEDPTVKHDVDDLLGDGDPLDVCEIGSAVLATGSVKTVKILGSLALVDDGELDWKVIVVDVNDELANEVFDIHDVFVKCPGLLEATREWFRDYKLPDGKPQNKFGLNGAYRNQKETVETIVECHEAWRKLVEGKSSAEGFAIENVSLSGTPGHLAAFEFNDRVLGSEIGPDAEIPAEISQSHFCSK